MYARVTVLEGGEFERDGGFATEPPEGVRSALVLADRERNRGLFIALFDSREAAEGAEGGLPEEAHGRRVSVGVYEVVLAEDFDDAKAARARLLEVPTAHIDDGVRYAQEVILPRVRELPGWKGALALIDRATGAARFMTFWESRDAMRASEAAAGGLADMSEADTELYDIVFNRRG